MLLAEAVPNHDFRALRDRAASLWRETDPIARTYLEVLRVTPPEVDRSARVHRGPGRSSPPISGDWYRLLMAGYLTPTRAFRLPDVMKRRLPELGWSPAEARRLAHGRELQSLADTYADAETIGALVPDLTLAERGWLTQGDVETTLDRFRALDAADVPPPPGPRGRGGAGLRGARGRGDQARPGVAHARRLTSPRGGRKLDRAVKSWSHTTHERHHFGTRPHPPTPAATTTCWPSCGRGSTRTGIPISPSASGGSGSAWPVGRRRSGPRSGTAGG